MARNREAFGLNGIAAQMPNAGALLQAQRTAAENAVRMAGATCHYAMSWNRAWMNIWSHHLEQYSQLPRRLADAQTSFVEEAFDRYQESIQELGGLAAELQEDAEGVMRETRDAGEHAIEEFRGEARDMAVGPRLKENRGPDEDQRVQREQEQRRKENKHQHSAH